METEADAAPQIIVTTGNEIAGHSIAQYLGIACGVTVRAPSGTEALLGNLKKLVGGNIDAYARLCDKTRQDSIATMILDAKRLNADAIIAFRFDATEFAPGIAEVIAYGTAVKLESSPVERG